MTRISFSEARPEGAPGEGGEHRRSLCGVRAFVRAVPSRIVHSSAGKLFCALLLASLMPAAGHAASRDVTIRWNPSTSDNVDFYVLSIGTSSGSYTNEMTLSSPSVSGNIWSKTVQLDDATDLYLALRAVNDEGQYSNYSNEIMIESAGGDPPPDPDFGVTSIEGVPNPASGEIFVEALVEGATESVAFFLDGTQVRVESSAPYSLNGDNGPGALNGWDTNAVADGLHVLSAIGYSEDAAAGEMGKTARVIFEVRNSPSESLGMPGKPMLVTD